ncbi:3-phosphoshikimate 1-carboxyvinyltransferase [Luteococcus sanguinis]|uniref:3-phosphoshikimate 1-carboxyvinyltransferase n=1 Tax=Luteococcus sanguinis TaxID=174038 RepID=A0ABW1X268_9ACTN
MSDPQTNTQRPWPAPAAPGPLHATVEVPGSKSETNRALLLAALADGSSTITGALVSRDSELMRAGLEAFGTQIIDEEGTLRVQPANLRSPTEPVDCGLAGTVMRFLPPVAALCAGSTRFVGDAHASNRPNGPILAALRQLGAEVAGDAIPCTVTGALTGREAVVDASGSSQFVSGLLLSGARFPRGLDLRHEGGPVPSRPHVEMTMQMLRERGVTVSEVGEGHWVVEPGPIAARDVRVEPDLTSSAVFLGAAALAGGSVSVPGWPSQTSQGGDEIRDLLFRMGAEVSLDGDVLTVSGTCRLRAIDADLSGSSELTPVVATLMAFADGTSTISGVAHIRGHETDRLAALETELGRLGVQVAQTTDGLRIIGSEPAHLHGALLQAYADHRMAHVAALAGLVVPGVELDDIACTSKTINDFDGLWRSMLAGSAGSAGSEGAR